MQVIDRKKSECGPQRRRNAYRRLLHCCCICGKLDTWDRVWTTYCSEKDIDDEVPIPKFCSSPCREKGGKNASNVTQAMKQTAKDAEWRAPEIAYREQTQQEKYMSAAAEQHRKKQRPTTDTGSVT